MLLPGFLGDSTRGLVSTREARISDVAIRAKALREDHMYARRGTRAGEYPMLVANLSCDWPS